MIIYVIYDDIDHHPVLATEDEEMVKKLQEDFKIVKCIPVDHKIGLHQDLINKQREKIQSLEDKLKKKDRTIIIQQKTIQKQEKELLLK